MQSKILEVIYREVGLMLYRNNLYPDRHDMLHVYEPVWKKCKQTFNFVRISHFDAFERMVNDKMKLDSDNNEYCVLFLKRDNKKVIVYIFHDELLIMRETKKTINGEPYQYDHCFSAGIDNLSYTTGSRCHLTISENFKKAIGCFIPVERK